MLGVATWLILIAGSDRADVSKQGGADSAGQVVKDADQGGKPGEVQADYELIPLDRLIGIAQLIVVGEVSKANDATLTLRITLTLAGEVSSPDIEVVQFTPSQFEGASRPAAYQPGQSFLFFLIKDEKHPMQKRWRILGIGGEGEMPLQDGFVYLQGVNVEGVPFGSYRVSGVERSVQRFEARVFFDAVKRYRSCFDWRPGREGRPEPAKICDEAAVDSYAQISALHQYLARLTAKRVTKK